MGTKPNYIKIFIGLIVSILLVGLLINSFVPEINMYVYSKINPTDFKYQVFQKLSKGTQEIYLLGTMHGDHLHSKGYSLLHIRAVIQNLHPDILLVESRPEELANDNWGDGPIEMPYASLTSRELGISVNGMDWWIEGKGNAGTTDDQRDAKMVKNILDHVKEYKTNLVLTGYSHIPDFITRLKSFGYIFSDFNKEDKTRLFATTTNEMFFPVSMTYYIQKRIAHDKKELKILNDPGWRRSISNAIKFRLQLLKVIKKIGEK